MGCKVYADNNEIACKAGDGKVVAAFPDVCLSPPSPPAGPVPVPYPDTSFSKDMQNGSKSVKIKGKEVMLKDKSFYKTSPLGDEAATKTLGAGVVTHVITGKTYFVAWSMDVKFEDENVDRHTDLTTSNHASPMPNEALTIPGLESMSKGELENCDTTYDKYKLRRHGAKPRCGEGMQSHHPAMNACFEYPRGVATIPGYKGTDAPAICLEDSTNGSDHYLCTQAQNRWARGLRKPPKYKELRNESKQILKQQVGMSEHEAECIMKVVDAYAQSINVNEDTTLNIPQS